MLRACQLTNVLRADVPDRPAYTVNGDNWHEARVADVAADGGVKPSRANNPAEAT